MEQIFVRLGVMNGWRSEKLLRAVFVLFLGQVVSLNLSVSSFTSSLLANHNVDVPLAQSLLTYLFLALVYTPILLYRRQRLLVPWYWYLLLGFIDVQANFLVIEAYQFSSITSVIIMACWTTPWAIIFTWIFLGIRYSLYQYFGAATCVMGLCLVLLSDSGGDSGSKNPLLGDGLVVVGTLCYALCSVGEEYCVKKKDFVELLSMLGIFGFLVSICQVSLTERNSLEAIKWSLEIISLFGGFTLSTFFFYSISSVVLKLGGAALYNLSLLTSGLWAVIFRIFVYHEQINWLYYLSFVIVVVGLVIYSVTDRNAITATDVENGDINVIQYQVLSDENADARIKPEAT